MTQPTVSGNETTSGGAVRLRLGPAPSRETVLDGAWWPRTAKVDAELPGLLSALTGIRGEITHVLLNAAEWDLPHPGRAVVGGGSVRLGWHTAQPAGLLTVLTDFGGDRFDLLVVPPDASRASADSVSTAAADSADRRHAPDLLATIEHEDRGTV